jgi:hypothetical protein
LAVERQEGPDFEEASSDVERTGDLCPVLKILEALPRLIAVIDDE